MRIAELVKLLAAPYSVQRAILSNTPQDAESLDFSKDNDISRMVLLYLDSWMPSEGDGGTEGVENWLARTQIPQELLEARDHPFWGAIHHLTTALNMIHALDRPFLYTRHGLRSAHEWELVRYLAGKACAVMDWPLEPQISSFSELWEALGDGVVEPF